MSQTAPLPEQDLPANPAEGGTGPGLSPAVWFMLATILIDSIGLGIIIPVLPGLMTELTGGELTGAARSAGWLGAIYALTQFFMAPVMGGLSDRFGRRPVLLASLGALGLDYILLYFAPGLGWLVAGRIIAGMTGASFAVAQAYLADVTAPERRSQAFGMVGAAFGLGFVLGPLIGGVAAGWGLRTPFLVAAILSLINVTYGYFVVPESLPKHLRRPFSLKRANPFGSLWQVSKYPAVGGLLACITLFYLSGHANQSASSYVAIERYQATPAQIGYFLTYVGVLITLVQGGVVRIVIARLGQRRAIWFGFGFYILGSVLISLASEWWMFYAFFAVQALGFVVGAAVSGAVSAQVPPNGQGELQGAIGALVSVTGAAGPVIMLQLFSYYTTAAPGRPYLPGVPYLAAGVLALGGALLFALVQHKLRSPALPPPLPEPVIDTPEGEMVGAG